MTPVDGQADYLAVAAPAFFRPAEDPRGRRRPRAPHGRAHDAGTLSLAHRRLARGWLFGVLVALLLVLSSAGGITGPVARR